MYSFTCIIALCNGFTFIEITNKLNELNLNYLKKYIIIIININININDDDDDDAADTILHKSI